MANIFDTKLDVEQAQEQVLQLKKIYAELLLQIKEERENEHSPIEQLESEQRNCTKGIELLNQKLQELKKKAQKRKNEIEAWKLWFDELDKKEKTEEFKQLENEIKWRSVDISRLENQINEQQHSLLLLETKREHLSIKQESLHPDLLAKPIEEDPRLLSILFEIEQLETHVAELPSETI